MEKNVIQGTGVAVLWRRQSDVGAVEAIFDGPDIVRRRLLIEDTHKCHKIQAVDDLRAAPSLMKRIKWIPLH